MLSLSMVEVLQARLSPDECQIWGGRQHYILPPSRDVAAAIEHLECKNGPLLSVRIVRKDTASKPCSHCRLSRCYKLVSGPDECQIWGGRQHYILPPSRDVAAAIEHLECKNGPLLSVRIVRKDTASKPCSHCRWSRCYKLVSGPDECQIWGGRQHTTSYLLVVMWRLQ